MSEQCKARLSNVTRQRGKRMTSFRSRIQPLAPMGTCIGANGLDSAAGTGVPAFCPGIVTFTAGLCTVPTSMSMAYSRVRNAERSMFIPPKFSPPRETFGGINMDLSALRTLESAKYGGTRQMSEQAKPGCKRQQCRGGGTPVPAAESKPLAPMGTCIGANGLDSAAGTGVPAFCPGIVTFTAGLCTVPTSMSMAYSKVL